MAEEVIIQTPRDCDICAQRGESKLAHYDAKTKLGPWAYMCESCWEFHGFGKLGTGLGQRLILASS